MVNILIRLRDKWSLAFYFMLAWGVANIWICSNLPLTDLSQHAGQITLFKDILEGKSKWADTFEINWFTPYLTSYLIAMMLSFVFSVSTALKIILSVTYLLFVYFCVQLRKHFQLDDRLDWLFILPFFGFTYQYGFLSYLVALPMGLWFILLADRYAKEPTKSGMFKLTLVGLLLLESHGLMFLFSYGVGVCLFLLQKRNIREYFSWCLPYLIVGGAFAIIFFINLQVNVKLGLSDYSLNSQQSLSDIIRNFMQGPKQLFTVRLPQAFFYNVAGSKISIFPLVHIPVVLILIFAPWLLGLRPGINKSSTIPFVFLVALFVFVPVYIFGTYFVYQRFSTLMLPFYAFLFSRKRSSIKLDQNIPLAMLLSASILLLAFNSLQSWKFSREVKEFDAILDRLEPNQKALVMPIDRVSVANNNSLVYGGYPLWYQANKHGLVYENFAIFAPMPVRFRQGKIYPVFDDGDPKSFRWKKHRGDSYRYFFIRNTSGKISREEFSQFFGEAPCPPSVFAVSGKWTVYENQPCGK